MTTITGTEIHNGLPANASGFTLPLTLTAINAALSRSWRTFKLSAYNAGVGTLARNTFEYDLSLTTYPNIDREIGVARVYVSRSGATPGEPERLLRGVRQRFDHANDQLTLVVPGNLAEKYNGDTLNIEYQHRHPPLTAIGDNIYLPAAYVEAYVMYWYARYFMSQENVSRNSWQTLMQEYRDEAEQLLRTQGFVPSIGRLPVIVGDKAA